MAQWAKRLLCKHKDLDLDLYILVRIWMSVYNPNAGDAVITEEPQGWLASQPTQSLSSSVSERPCLNQQNKLTHTKKKQPEKQ